MATTILQVRDIPQAVMDKLRERADEQGISLSQYVRNLLAYDAATETNAEVIARIRTRTPVEVSGEEIVAAIHEGRT